MNIGLYEISQAVARGWCHAVNSSKVMDQDLAHAIALEVQAVLPADLASPPDHAAQLAAALKLPEVSALVESAKEQIKLHRVLKPHGIAADTCDRDLRAALAALEGKP